MSQPLTAAASSPSPSWKLVRVWHVETLSTVAQHPEAKRFLRTSYGIVPASWGSLSAQAMLDRVLFALNLSYGVRNAQSARAGDPAEMLWIAASCELVDEGSRSSPVEDAADDELVSVRIDRPIHRAVIEGAAQEVIAARRSERDGIQTQPWQRAFSAFRFDEDGDTCHLLRHPERAAAFAAAFAEPAP